MIYWREVMLVATCCCPLLVTSYKYLMFTPGTFKKAGSQSHMHIASKIAQVLSNGGHDVTLVVQGDDLDLPGVKIIQSPVVYPDETFDEMREFVKAYTTNMITGEEVKGNKNIFLEVMQGQCEAMLTSKELLENLRKEKFDFAIVDHFHGCGYLVAQILGLRYAVLECSSAISMLVDSRTAHPLSHVPVFATHQTDSMSFFQRANNALWWIILQLTMMPMVDSPTIAAHQATGVLPGVNLEQLRRKAELWFVNNDWSLEFPRPVNPNTIFIGGILTGHQPKPISKDLQDWINSGDHQGIILVTFGSALNIADMPDIQKVLFTAFGRLPYKVIMGSKFKVTNLPANVKVMSWIPQYDLLAMSNSTKLLITHGGINSVYEAIFWAVPVLIFPLTTDGPDQAIRAENKGFGIKEDLKSVTADHLVATINRIITTKSFKENAERASGVMRDSLHTPAQRVLFWMEYLCRYGNAQHLRSTALDLSWTEYLMIDVALFFLAIIILTLALIFTILKCLYRLCCHLCKGRHKEKQS